jgi:hypothetical protein
MSSRRADTFTALDADPQADPPTVADERATLRRRCSHRTPTATGISMAPYRTLGWSQMRGRRHPARSTRSTVISSSSTT